MIDHMERGQPICLHFVNYKLMVKGVQTYAMPIGKSIVY